MVKLLVFAILLVSPASGLIETLFRTENSCYSGCHTNKAASAEQLNACKQGCDFQLHNENCADKCNTIPGNEEIHASCQVGCTLGRPNESEKPIIAVDPVPGAPVPNVIPANPEPERPRSIILIRLRQRPSVEMPSMERFFNTDPIQMFNDMIRQFRERTQNLDQAIRQSFEENAKDLPKPPEFPTISELVKTIPVIRIPTNMRVDSSSESSEEPGKKHPLIDEFRHIIKHPREQQQFIRERMQPMNNRFQQFVSNVRSEWNDLLHKQPKIPVWVFIGILLTSSAILWYMVMALCRHTPTHNTLSIRAQELVFHPYEYDAYEKEKIQPDDQPYEVTESLPIKVKLSNI